MADPVEPYETAELWCHAGKEAADEVAGAFGKEALTSEDSAQTEEQNSLDHTSQMAYCNCKLLKLHDTAMQPQNPNTSFGI